MGNSKGIVTRLEIEIIRNEVRKRDELNMSNKYKLHEICKSLDLTELIIPTLDGEIWEPLVTPLYPSINSYYYISNKNRVYNIYNNKFLKIYHKDPKNNESPYYRVSLQTNINGTSVSKDYLMHRLLMAVFKPVDNMDKLCINHIDGNKLNNDLDNLEWCSIKENTLHALNTGLFVPVYGEEHVCSTITEQQAKNIISMLLEKRYSYKYIADIVGTTKTIVCDIAGKNSWKYLTKDISKKDLQFRAPLKLTVDSIHKICKYFEENPKPNNMSIRRYCMNALEFINYNPIGEGITNSVRKIYTHERFTDISSQYHF